MARAAVDFTPNEWEVLLPLLLAGFFETYEHRAVHPGRPCPSPTLGLEIDLLGVGGSVPVLRPADRFGRHTPSPSRLIGAGPGHRGQVLDLAVREGVRRRLRLDDDLSRMEEWVMATGVR